MASSVPRDLSRNHPSGDIVAEESALKAGIRALEYAWRELQDDPVGRARLVTALHDFVTRIFEKT